MIEHKVTFMLIWGVIASMLTYIGLREETFVIFTGLLVLDYITGIWKAKTLNQKITSHRMKYGIVSKMSLLIIPIVLGLGAKALNQNASVLLFWGVNLLILSEVYSVVGNVHTIRTGKEMPEIDAVSAIGNKIATMLGGGK